MMKKRPCDHEQCEGEGTYRAPKGRHALRDYHWFCLRHVKEYNKNWNYFDGMSEEEIAIAYHAKDRGLDEMSDRLPFPSGVLNLLTDSVKKEFAEMWGTGGSDKAREGARYGIFLAQMLDMDMEMSLRVLGLSKREITEKMALDATKRLERVELSRDAISALVLEIVRKRYRQLAKVVHPDMHKGPDAIKQGEDFQRVNEAYTLLCRRLGRVSLDD